jgi:hypothetical protein
MKRRSITVIATLILLLCIVLLVIYPFKKDIWDTNLQLLESNILSDDLVGKKVNLTTLTPFEWDTVYSFNPYTSKETIYETIGYKWDNISETVNEGMNQIVFVKDGEVVCYIYGYPTNNKYGVYFNGTDNQNSAAILYEKDNEVFDVTKSDGVVFLTRIINN